MWEVCENAWIKCISSYSHAKAERGCSGAGSESDEEAITVVPSFVGGLVLVPTKAWKQRKCPSTE